MASDSISRTIETAGTSQTYVHPLSGSTLLPILVDFLPHNISLYRRIQNPDRTPYTHIVATFPPRPLPPPYAASTIGGDQAEWRLPQCFAVAIIDRSVQPETEVFLFVSGEVKGRCDCPKHYFPGWDGWSVANSANGSVVPDPWEVPHGAALSSSSSSSSSSSRPPCASAVLSLMQYGANLEQPPTDPLSTHSSHLYKISPEFMKIGSASALAVAILQREGLLDTTYHNFAYVKYLFRDENIPQVGLEPKSIAGDGTNAVRGGEGLQFGKLTTEAHFDLSRSRTIIPRRNVTLRRLGNVAIFPSEAGDSQGATQPIAWAFFGPEGALASLHVEPQYRGRGLAKAVGAKLLEEYKQSDGWAHADVGVSNEQSAGVCKALGGHESWVAWWIRVLLEEVRKVHI
jgi:GNAT superfamily N-acetyltransferase